jgi:ABC-type phosphate transport system permease subunit
VPSSGINSPITNVVVIILVICSLIVMKFTLFSQIYGQRYEKKKIFRIFVPSFNEIL